MSAGWRWALVVVTILVGLYALASMAPDSNAEHRERYYQWCVSAGYVPMSQCVEDARSRYP